MSKVLKPPTGLYFEEFDIGDSAVTASRTVTEADIILRVSTPISP